MATAANGSPSWKIAGKLSRYGDLALAGLVVGIVGMMVVPLPTPVLDVLLATNIALAITLLLVAIYVAEALRFAVFPTLLLVTTLFRLGLNVSSTRLILLDGFAGQVIYSFGNFVVSGNLVVGIVVFLILTIIQFVVIAKGSERVAEVAARFTLDAMPGKQMAIDADLRAGAIELNEARRQRRGLQRESQLYGAMDGAMKFVKGDAIAAILITLINIGAGLLIGVFQRGMPAAEAASVYALLTVGDGLVSQIPALLISISAGIIVTRVASEESGSDLGRDIGRQVFAQPRALSVTATLLALLALVPGLPFVPFALLALGVGALALAATRNRDRGAPQQGIVADSSGDAEDPLQSAALQLELGRGLAATLLGSQSQQPSLAAELLPGLRQMLYQELGLLLPLPRVRSNEDLPVQAYRLVAVDVPLAEGEIPADTILARADQSQHEALRREEPTIGPLEVVAGLDGLAFRARRDQTNSLQERGLELIDPATEVVLHLGQALRDNAGDLIGIQETQLLLDRLENEQPALVGEVVPRLVSVQTLAEILRRLLEEGIPIRDLSRILHAVGEWATSEKDPAVLVEHVRVALKRYLSHRYTAGSGVLHALLLDPQIEQTIRESIHRTDKDSYLAIEPSVSRDIVEAVQRQLAQSGLGQPLALLTNLDVRRYTRRLLELDCPNLPVLSYNELQPSVEVRPVARVDLQA